MTLSDRARELADMLEQGWAPVSLIETLRALTEENERLRALIGEVVEEVYPDGKGLSLDLCKRLLRAAAGRMVAEEGGEG